MFRGTACKLLYVYDKGETAAAVLWVWRLWGCVFTAKEQQKAPLSTRLFGSPTVTLVVFPLWCETAVLGVLSGGLLHCKFLTLRLSLSLSVSVCLSLSLSLLSLLLLV